MSWTEVHNLNGTSDNKVPSQYTSWKDFWEKKTGRSINICSRKNCLSKATDGAHVQKVSGGNEWYIVPLCHADNLKSEGARFEVKTDDLYPVRDR